MAKSTPWPELMRAAEDVLVAYRRAVQTGGKYTAESADALYSEWVKSFRSVAETRPLLMAMLQCWEISSHPPMLIGSKRQPCDAGGRIIAALRLIAEYIPQDSAS